VLADNEEKLIILFQWETGKGSKNVERLGG